MASPTDAPGVFTEGDSHNNVGDWHTLLLSNELSSQCEFEHMVYGKCTTSVEHEFLFLHFRHPTQHHAVAVLVLYRTSRPDSTENNNGSGNDNGSSRSVGIGQSTVVSPSVSATPAHDSIFTTPNNGSAIESYQCYWYAYTVWEALKRLFPGCRETTLSEGRSRFCRQGIRKAESVEAVCEQYRAEWARFENAAEEKRRAKEEVRRVRMECLAEGRARCQPEVDEERRQREEAERKAYEAGRRADEERRQREEAEREHEAENEPNPSKSGRARAPCSSLTIALTSSSSISSSPIDPFAMYITIGAYQN